MAILAEELRERREKKSTSTGYKVLPGEVNTKETNTKETLKKREERELQDTPSLSKEENQTEELNQRGTLDLKEKINNLVASIADNKENPKKKKDPLLHEWLVKEQAAYIKEYGEKDIEKVDWLKYIADYYPGPQWKKINQSSRLGASVPRG
jgi:flagellar hook protein FlgE